MGGHGFSRAEPFALRRTSERAFSPSRRSGFCGRRADLMTGKPGELAPWRSEPSWSRPSRQTRCNRLKQKRGAAFAAPLGYLTARFSPRVSGFLHVVHHRFRVDVPGGIFCRDQEHVQSQFGDVERPLHATPPLAKDVWVQCDRKVGSRVVGGLTLRAAPHRQVWTHRTVSVRLGLGRHWSLAGIRRRERVAGVVPCV